MVIVEFADYKILPYMSNYAPFIYETYPQRYEPASFWTETFGVSTDPGDISNISVLEVLRGAKIYDSTLSLVACVAQEKTFFWDFKKQKLYIHCEHEFSNYDVQYSYAFAVGFSDKDVVYIDNIEYLPLIKSVPRIRQQEDILNYRSLSFVTGVISLSNESGIVDTLIGANLFGNKVNLYHIPVFKEHYSRDDLIPVACFYIEDYTYSTQEVSISVQDVRKAQNISIPTNRFSKDEYPDIQDDFVSKIVPLAYGSIRSSLAIPTNGEASGNVAFRIAQVVTSAGTIQVEVSGVWVTRAPVSTDYDNGSFTLAFADCRSGGSSTGDILKCRMINYVGLSANKPHEIIVDLNNRALGVIWNDSNYNTIEWVAEGATLEPVGVLYYKEILLFNAIRDLQNSSTDRFRYEISANGRRTIRLDDWNRPVLARVEKTDHLIEELQISTNSVHIAADVKINYSIEYVTNKSLSYFDDSRGYEVSLSYRQRPLMEVDTLLTVSGHAAQRATLTLDRFSSVPLVASLTLLGVQWYTLRIYDILRIELLEGFFDIDSGKITGREFFGVWKAQVISISPRMEFFKNSIKCVLIEKEI